MNKKVVQTSKKFWTLFHRLLTDGILHDQSGFVTALTALMLPMILLMGALIIDGGNLYLRQSQIQHLSRQAGHSGLMVFSDLLKTQAQNNYRVICNTEEPPDICSSHNPFDFLANSEINLLAQNVTHQNAVAADARKFIRDFDPQENIFNEDITITFPHNFTGGNRLEILVEINNAPHTFFSQVLITEKKLQAQAKSFLTLQ